MSNIAIVVTNGSIEDLAALRARLAGLKDAYVIAADGGVLHAISLGLLPDAVVGDLDSLDEESRAALASTSARLVPSLEQKDQTDFELALLYAADWGAEDIIVLGALGGRLDMTLANVLLLTHPGLASIRIELWHGAQTAWLIRHPGDEIHGQPGDTLSLIPLGGDAVGITTHDLAYPLHNETLAFGPARGVSNVLAGPAARIELHSGTLLAIHTPGRA